MKFWRSLNFRQKIYKHWEIKTHHKKAFRVIFRVPLVDVKQKITISNITKLCLRDCDRPQNIRNNPFFILLRKTFNQIFTNQVKILRVGSFKQKSHKHTAAKHLVWKCGKQNFSISNFYFCNNFVSFNKSISNGNNIV